MAKFASKREKVEELLLELDSLDLTPGAGTEEGTKKSVQLLRDEVTRNLDAASVQSKVVQLLANRGFRRAGLLKKSELIDVATGGGAPLRLLHWKVLKELGELPPMSKDSKHADDVPSAIERTLALKPAIKLMCEGDTEKGRDLILAEKCIVPVYLSHTWLRKDHPDTRRHTKAKTLVRFATWLMDNASQQKIDCEVFFFVDYCCMETNPAPTICRDLGVVSLPLFMACCEQVLTWRTPDFDRRCWSMLERLMAYSFCPGGLTPYAVDGTSFRAADELASDSEEDGPAKKNPVVPLPMVEDEENPKLGVLLPVKPASGKVSPTTASMSVQVLRRTRKLPDPLDPLVCKLGATTTSAQRQ
jgi:hypothetical protein